MRKKEGTKTEITKDYTTGEIITEKINFTKFIPSEDSFIKMYLKDLALFYRCLDKEAQVFLEMLRRLNYHNQIVLQYKDKEDICRELKIFRKGTEEVSVNSFNVMLSRVVQKGLLVKITTGLYLANPLIFAKGKWSEVQEIRLSFIYNKDGRAVETETK